LRWWHRRYSDQQYWLRWWHNRPACRQEYLSDQQIGLRRWHENNNTGTKIREQGRPVSGSFGSGTEVGVPSVANCAEKIKQKSHGTPPFHTHS